MANTVFVRGGSHSASVEEVWGEKTWRQAEKDAYFNDGKFVGASSNSIIQVNVDLTKNKGDRINTPLRARLISDGKVDDEASEGQEARWTMRPVRDRKRRLRSITARRLYTREKSLCAWTVK